MMVYTSFIWGLTIGLLVGAFIGVGIMCLMITAKESDKRMEQYYNEHKG
jgi:NhaP-type Na+/H+ or K+/H+ antiporter